MEQLPRRLEDDKTRSGLNFLDLPLEIRTMIYRHFASSLRILVVHSTKVKDFRIEAASTTPQIAAILQTNSHVKAEALPLFKNEVFLDIIAHGDVPYWSQMPLLPTDHILLSLSKARVLFAYNSILIP